jgi:hypothetical protein
MHLYQELSNRYCLFNDVTVFFRVLRDGSVYVH